MKRTLLSTFILFASITYGCAQATVNKTIPIKKPTKERIVEISTEFGTIAIKLYNETPLHRDNFIKLAQAGFYNETLFHRVINNFMIQGGDPDSRNAAPEKQLGNGGPDYTIKAEFVDSIFHKKGALAAARLGDNMNPNKESSGSQFYIVHGRVFSEAELDMMEKRMNKKFTDKQKQIYTTLGGTPHLDGAYTVFGEVILGLEVVDKIAAVKTQPGDRPVNNVKMKVRVIE